MNDLMYQIQEIKVPQFNFALNPNEKEAIEPQLKVGGSVTLKGEELTVMIRVSTERNLNHKYHLDAIAVGLFRVKNYVDNEEQRGLLKRIGFATVYPYLRSSISGAASVLANYKLDLGIIDVDSTFEKAIITIAD